MADLFSLLLLLLPPVSCSLHTHKDPAVLPPPAQILAALRNQETSHVDPKLTHTHVDHGNSKVGIFIVAAAGTCTFMAVVYCIYSKFYSKQPYLHTQLEEDSDLTGSPSMCFQAAGEADMRGGTGYGSLSDTPSVISVPPYLSPPPSSMPFPPRFASSSSCSSARSLRTISAKDLQQSCI